MLGLRSAALALGVVLAAPAFGADIQEMSFEANGYAVKLRLGPNIGSPVPGVGFATDCFFKFEDNGGGETHDHKRGLVKATIVAPTAEASIAGSVGCAGVGLGATTPEYAANAVSFGAGQVVGYSYQIDQPASIQPPGPVFQAAASGAVSLAGLAGGSAAHAIALAAAAPLGASDPCAPPPPDCGNLQIDYFSGQSQDLAVLVTDGAANPIPGASVQVILQQDYVVTGGNVTINNGTGPFDGTTDANGIWDTQLPPDPQCVSVIATIDGTTQRCVRGQCPNVVAGGGH
jgi:hypothetical protein